MKEELLNQYSHAWKMFYRMVEDFDQASWTETGCSYIVPARISYHIIGGVNYYTENGRALTLPSGRAHDWNWEHGPIDGLPTRGDILSLIRSYKAIADDWIRAMDLEAANEKFPYTGKNRASVAMFLLRHMEYHVGELNLLLHISKGGRANDNWIRAFEELAL